MSKTTQIARTAPHVIDVRTLPEDTIFVGFVGVSAVTLSRIEDIFSWDKMSNILAQFSTAALYSLSYAADRNEVDRRAVDIFTQINQWLAYVVEEEYKIQQNAKGGAQ